MISKDILWADDNHIHINQCQLVGQKKLTKQMNLDNDSDSNSIDPSQSVCLNMYKSFSLKKGRKVTLHYI